MITQQQYQLAKRVIDLFETQKNHLSQLISHEDIEKEATRFSMIMEGMCGSLVSDDYKTGYKEGIEHYLQYLNKM